MSETGRLGQVADDLATFDTRVVVLVDQERLDDDEDLVHIGPDEVVELVEDAVDNLDEQVTFLVFERAFHQEREDLVEQRTGTEIARLVGDLPQRRLSHRRRSVLDLEQEAHDLAFLEFLDRELALVFIRQDLSLTTPEGKVSQRSVFGSCIEHTPAEEEVGNRPWQSTARPPS